MENAVPSTFFVSAAWGRGRGGRWQWRASLQGWTSLPALQDLSAPHPHLLAPKDFPRLGKARVLPPLITCCSLCCFGGFCHLHRFISSVSLKPSARRKQSPTCWALGQEHNSRIFTSKDKPLIKSQVSAAINAGRVLPCLMPSEKQQGFTSEKRFWINLEVR